MSVALESPDMFPHTLSPMGTDERDRSDQVRQEPIDFVAWRLRHGPRDRISRPNARLARPIDAGGDRHDTPIRFLGEWLVQPPRPEVAPDGEGN
jgi:hypothetical protein